MQKKIIAAKNEAKPFGPRPFGPRPFGPRPIGPRPSGPRAHSMGRDEAYHFEERDDISLENREESYPEVYERDIYERYDLD